MKYIPKCFSAHAGSLLSSSFRWKEFHSDGIMVEVLFPKLNLKDWAVIKRESFESLNLELLEIILDDVSLFLCQM